MNKKSRNTTPESLLFWDIETVRRQKELDVNSDEFALYQYKFRNKETGELMPDAEVVKHYEKNAALYPAYNKIVKSVELSNNILLLSCNSFVV